MVIAGSEDSPIHDIHKQAWTGAPSEAEQCKPGKNFESFRLPGIVPLPGDREPNHVAGVCATQNTTLNHLVILICFSSNSHFTDDRRNVHCFGFSSPELGLFSQPICCWLVLVWVVQIQLAGSQWSHPFAIQKEESLHLMIRHDNGLRQSVQVDIRGYEDGSRFLVFFRLGSSRGPYRSIIDLMGALIFVLLNFSFQYL